MPLDIKTGYFKSKRCPLLWTKHVKLKINKYFSYVNNFLLENNRLKFKKILENLKGFSYSPSDVNKSYLYKR